MSEFQHRCRIGAQKLTYYICWSGHPRTIERIWHVHFGAESDRRTLPNELQFTRIARARADRRFARIDREGQFEACRTECSPARDMAVSYGLQPQSFPIVRPLTLPFTRFSFPIKIGNFQFEKTSDPKASQTGMSSRTIAKYRTCRELWVMQFPLHSLEQLGTSCTKAFAVIHRLNFRCTPNPLLASTTIDTFLATMTSKVVSVSWIFTITVVIINFFWVVAESSPFFSSTHLYLAGPRICCKTIAAEWLSSFHPSHKNGRWSSTPSS